MNPRSNLREKSFRHLLRGTRPAGAAHKRCQTLIFRSIPATRRNGITLIELIVAATLIISGLALVGKLTVLTGRMWQQTRHERIAIEELSNQMERLLALPAADRDAAIAELKLSDEASTRLPNARLVADTTDDSAGLRVELRLEWNRGVPAGPIKLTGWFEAAGERDVPESEVRS